MLLNNSMELKCLSGRNFESSRPVLIGNLIHLQPLAGLAHATRHSYPNHEAVCRLNTLGLSFITDISVILLVYSVEFRDLPVAGSQCAGASISEAFSNRPTQVAGCSFNVLIGDRFWLCFMHFYRVNSESLP